ncbi:phage baseplate assembly protein V [Porphyrobacter sp. YT40]|uniref:phage baseplate assembly protein V n=1 Tax=Porphyrobacter sp. YT40 TaxID=2547601 RepID=UPI001141CEE3|nr:phage baseplate assembly protein V [Porphyrobacter sp. YT40]QDH35858.1 phage baseplate assembly protein V [Porphyrobacter sp. YT40]
MIGEAREMLSGLEGRVRGMVARAIVRLVDDARQAQELQVELLADESQDAVERFQNYGLTSVPHAGAEALVVFAGGLRSHGVVLAVEDRRYRLTGLQDGEVALFDDLGNVIKLGRQRIDVTAVTELLVTAPKVIVQSDNVRLGEDGGAAVARVGDDVNLSTGKIVSGSSKVRAA